MENYLGGPMLWNEIPTSVRDSESLHIFKKRLQEFVASLDTDNFFVWVFFCPVSILDV